MVADPSSRFQLVPLALRAPGESFLTRNVNGPFIDTKLDIGLDGRMPFRGRVYIAVSELREMADQAGLFDEYKQVAFQATADLGELEGAAYQRGFEDGLKENDRDDTELFNLLRDVADRLPHHQRPAVLDAADVEADAGADAPVAPDNPFLVALPTGEGTSTGRGKRPAGVPVNPSDGDTAAVQ